ncbi:MAG: aromatic ring-hydroxylating dioxygenase subunit alpha [Chloroflexi bacterium]|nr:aromatic ring-hydroxylating dioxygenase subunit alpha [Chloroflexota bacterium]
MLSRAHNERVTRTGPGTPMGAVMRRYWIPAMLSSELPSPDSDPVRITLLGEQLIAFRATDGRVGLLAHNCPHRGASLFFGRNEEAGLRCVYHGWKFDVDGTCVDMPNEPAESDFKSRVKATAYPTVEQAGVVWTFMGAGAPPPLQSQEWMRVPAENLDVCKHLGEANWLQLLEGGIDTAHSSFLHRTFGWARGLDTHGFRARSTAPKLEVVTTEYGYTYAGIRSLPDQDRKYVRVYQFVLPFHQMRAFEGYLGHALISGHIWVPADDETTWVWSWTYSAGGEPLPAEVVEAEKRSGGRSATDVVPGTFRFRRNKDNDYLIDRQKQKTVNYTGIDVIAAQDQAVQESMGSIFDRSQEHLGSSDVAIIAARKLLLQACDDVERGQEPLGSRLETITTRPAEMVLPQNEAWYAAMRDHLVAAV